MRFFLSTFILALLVALALAAAPQHPIVVSYPAGTPNSVLEEAKAAIIKAGGIITHEYNLIKGFAARAPAKIKATVETLGASHNVLVEQDKEVSVNSS